ncbi:hypothetical protein PMAYCL1PPCAC_04261, partial [Pristionchus mayeri]
MIDIRISAVIMSVYILLLLATPLRWFRNGWRDFTRNPTAELINRVEEELSPVCVNKLLTLLYLTMIVHTFYATVLRPIALRLQEREIMERERIWRDEQLRTIARMQREEREREERMRR